jgi:PD-(D/E)XK nuclease superfamily protein
MTVVAAKRPVNWSYSVLSMFENCPYKYWAVKIAKKVSDVNQWNLAGDEDHQSIKLYMKKGIALAPALAGLKPMFDKIKAAPGERYIEYDMALDANFTPCGYKDWNKAWVRAAGDYVVVDGTTARYFDWKRGKYSESDDQITLTSLVLFQHFPAVERVVAGLVFYNKGRLYPHVVNRVDMTLLWNGYLGRVKELQAAVNADHFPKTPNPLCAYCPVMDCQHNSVEARLKRERENLK